MSPIKARCLQILVLMLAAKVMQAYVVLWEHNARPLAAHNTISPLARSCAEIKENLTSNDVAFAHNDGHAMRALMATSVAKESRVQSRFRRGCATEFALVILINLGYAWYKKVFLGSAPPFPVERSPSLAYEAQRDVIVESQPKPNAANEHERVKRMCCAKLGIVVAHEGRAAKRQNVIFYQRSTRGITRVRAFSWALSPRAGKRAIESRNGRRFSPRTRSKTSPR